MREVKTFAIYKREADTCGNEDCTLIGFFRSETQATAEQEFPRGFLTGYHVEEVIPETRQALHARARRTQ